MENPKIRFKGFTKDWEQRKFGSLLEETRNKTIFEDEDTLLSCAIDGMYLNSELFSHFRGSSNIGYLKVKKNDLILSAQNLHLGNCNVNLRFEHGIISPAYKVYELVGCNPLFMQAWVKKDSTKDFFLKSSTEGASVCRKNIVWEELYKQELPVPSIEEQTKVGEYFYSLDHLITLHQRKCEQTKNLKKYMLQKMFPQNGAKVPEIRFNGFTHDWEQRKLSEITTMHARIGWQNLRTSEFLDSGDYMLITGTDFNDGAINYSTCHFVERERYEQDKHIQIKNGSILITKDGTLGKVAYVQGLSMPATLNAGVFNVEIKDETEVNDKYLFQYLKAPFLMDYVNKKATGGTIKHLNQNILFDFPVFMPSKAEQEEIGTYFEKLDNLITLHQRQCDELKKMKKYMLQNMFI